MSKEESSSPLASDRAKVAAVTARQDEGLSLPLASGSRSTVPGVWVYDLLTSKVVLVHLFQKVLFLQRAGLCPEQLHQLTAPKCESSLKEGCV